MTRATRSAPLPIIILMISFLCPTELSLDIAGLRLPPHRLAMIVLLPIALFKLLTGREQRLRIFDVLFVAYAGWTVFVYALHSGQPGFVYGGSLALEALGGFFVARVFVRTADELKATMRAVVAAIAAAALIALPETLFGKTFTHDLLRQVTGYVHPTTVETRLGLTRAYGTFDHPIHYGTFCAALLALFWYAERNALNRYLKAGFIGFATLLGLSSAPILCLGLQGGMLVWERLTRGIAGRLAISFAAVAAAYVAVMLFSARGPIALIATGLTLDPWTGFYRLQIWEAGLANVARHPLTGLGLAEWNRPWWMISDTIDAFWLVVTMRQGIPAVVLLVLAIVLLARAVLLRRHRHVDGQARDIAMGWVMTVIALSLVGATVHYWNVLHAFLFFVLGLGGWIADPARSETAGFAIRKGEQRRTPAAAAQATPSRPVHARPYPGVPGELATYGRPYGIMQSRP